MFSNRPNLLLYRRNTNCEKKKKKKKNTPAKPPRYRRVNYSLSQCIKQQPAKLSAFHLLLHSNVFRVK